MKISPLTCVEDILLRLLFYGISRRVVWWISSDVSEKSTIYILEEGETSFSFETSELCVPARLYGVTPRKTVILCNFIVADMFSVSRNVIVKCYLYELISSEV